MKHFIKKLTAVLLVILTVFSLMIPVFAADSSDDKKITTEKAIKIALAAAKAKYAIEGIPSDVTEKATVTKIKYNKGTSSYDVTVRADRVYKYTCTVSVKNFLGAELGVPENTNYIKKNAVSGFFGQLGERIAYFFIKLFRMDEAK